MCLAIVGKVERIDEVNAIVKTAVNIVLIESLQIGDYVLVHTGFAIEKVN